MAFSSTIHPDEPVIGDGYSGTASDPPVGQSKGLDITLRPRGDSVYGSLAQAFPPNLIVPRSEWQARIQEREEKKQRLQDIADQAGLPCKDQNGTNYCWINAPVHCLELVRVRQNEPTVILSPASAGAQIKNFQNRGGWGKEGLEWIVDKGVAPISMWPANAINRKYLTPETTQESLKYRVTEWWEIKPRNLDELISALFLGPVAVGLNWWEHEVTYYDPIWVDGTIACRIRNSWAMTWGDRGYGILQGSKMLADDAVMARVAMAA